MIVAVLSLYFMSLFRVREGIAEATKSKMRDRADGDSHCRLVAWDCVDLNKDKGGLGIENKGLRNMILLGEIVVEICCRGGRK